MTLLKFCQWKWKSISNRVVRFFRIDLHPPKSFCPGPERSVRPENAEKKLKTTSGLMSKIWVFIDFQAKSQFCALSYSKWFLWNYTLNDLFIWLQNPKFNTRWRLYNLCSHFYNKNFVIQGNLGLLTLLIKGLIVLKLQVQTGGGYSLCNQIFWYGHPLGWPYEDFEGGARYFLMILTTLMCKTVLVLKILNTLDNLVIFWIFKGEECCNPAAGSM